MIRYAMLAPALAVVVAAATPVQAHGPLPKSHAAPPGATAPPGPLIGPDALSPPVKNVGTPTTGVRPLRLLAPESVAIVVADVTRTEAYDDDQLRLHRLHVVRVLRGRVDVPEPGVVDLRVGARRAPLLSPGERVVVLLRPAPGLSYLREHLPEGEHYDLVGGRDGIIAVEDAASLEAVEQALTAGAAARDEAARRALAFSELRGPCRRLVADAVVELHALAEIDPLAPDEVDALARVLRDEKVDATTRGSLIELLGERGSKTALPALRGARTDTPAVLDDLLTARARLGAAPDRNELAQFLRDADPAMRAAAVRAIARLDDPEAIADVGRHATQGTDPAMRLAAIQGLGETHKPAAIPFLVQTFRSADREVKQATARAFLEIGGPAAADALVGLALGPESADTQTYAILLLIASRGRDDPAVRRVATSNPSPAVKKILEHGLEFHHVHKHGEN